MYAKIVSLVTEKLNRAKEKQKHHYDKTHRDEKFETGDLVLLKDFPLSDKEKGISASLSPLYRTTVATITRVLSNLDYDVTFPDGSVKSPVHVQNLRRYHARCNFPTPKLSTTASPPSKLPSSSSHQISNSPASSSQPVSSSSSHNNKPL